MKLKLAAAVAALGLGVSAAHADSPLRQSVQVAPVVAFAPLGSPTVAVPAPAASRQMRMPAWQSGFSSPEQLRDEMASHQGWGGG
jgi:hypothetical protein